jgi:plasmid stability protein
MMDEDIQREIKVRAARDGVTIKEFVATLLRKALGIKKG